MPSDAWKHRARLFVQRFWQPTSACIACMPGSFGAVTSVLHWQVALKTGLATGVLVFLVSLTPADALFRRRWPNAIAVGVLTMIGDAYSHRQHGDALGLEVVVTGVVSALFALVASFLFEDRARRLREAWRRVTRRTARPG